MQMVEKEADAATSRVNLTPSAVRRSRLAVGELEASLVHHLFKCKIGVPKTTILNTDETHAQVRKSREPGGRSWLAVSPADGRLSPDHLFH